MEKIDFNAPENQVGYSKKGGGTMTGAEMTRLVTDPYGWNGGGVGGANKDMMQMFKEAIAMSMNAGLRSQRQTAIGAANAIGGVYGHNLQSESALSGQNLQSKTSMRGQDIMGEGEANRLALETKKAFMPMPGDMGTSGSGLGVGIQPINIGDISKRIDEIMGGK